MTNKLSRSSSLDRALSILDCFTERDYYLTLKDLTEKADIPRSTVFRMLTSLESFGYIKSHQRGGKTYYSLGYAFLEKGVLVHRQLDIRALARDEMIHLRNDFNLTVQLAIRDGRDALYVEQVPSFRPIQIYPAVGRAAPLYAAACPRVLLAYMPDQEQADLLAAFDYQSYTPETITDPGEIKKRLQEIQARGYDLSRGELFQGTLAMAVPIFCPHTKEVLAALSVIGLEDDFNAGKEAYITALKAAAQRVAEQVQ